jgi:hypothetical protein
MKATRTPPPPSKTGAPAAPARDPESTLDLMRALEHAVVVTDEAAVGTPATEATNIGYNPYDVARDPSRPRK